MAVRRTDIFAKNRLTFPDDIFIVIDATPGRSKPTPSPYFRDDGVGFTHS